VNAAINLDRETPFVLLVANDLRKSARATRFATAMMRRTWVIETSRGRVGEDVKSLRVGRVKS
jgi:hypothetical protein